MKNPFLLLVQGLALLFNLLSAQTEKQMKLIPGGSFVMGYGYEFTFENGRMYYNGTDTNYAHLNQKAIAIGEVPSENIGESIVTLSSFYISESEVTNKEYKEFLVNAVYDEEEQKLFYKELEAAIKNKSGEPQEVWKKVFIKADSIHLLPDQECWENDFAFGYNDPLVTHYLWHPAYDNYPVVGVSWDQANAYCDWLTYANNQARMKKGLTAQPSFRLPSEAEWEYAARGSVNEEDAQKFNHSIFPWEGRSVSSKGEYLANIKTGPGDYIGDNYEYTAPVKSFPENNFGLYEMAGNVAEWTSDSFNSMAVENTSATHLPGSKNAKVVKGGSWATFAYGVRCGSRTFCNQNKGASWVGFRVARNVAGNGEKVKKGSSAGLTWD